MDQETSKINQNIKVVKENWKGSLLMFELIHKPHTLSVSHTNIFHINGCLHYSLLEWIETCYSKHKMSISATIT